MNTLKPTLKNVPNHLQCFDKKACVQKIDTIEFIGDISPNEWNFHVVTEKGTADNNAIALLATIVFHYRSIARPFKSDMWQQTNKELAKRLNLTKFQVTSGLIRLEKLGLIIRELRTVDTSSGRLPNVQFIAPVAEKVCAISITKASEKTDKVDDFFEQDDFKYQNHKGLPSEKPGDCPLENSYTLQRDILDNKEEEGSILKTLTEILQNLPEKIAAAVFLLNEKKENDCTVPSPTTVPTSPIGKLPALTLMPQEGIIREELTENQKTFALQHIANKAKVTEERLPTLTEEILVGIVDPKCFAQCGVSFGLKINSILKSVNNGTWSAPISMLLKEKKQEDTETKVKNQALSALIIKHREALCAYAHWKRTIGFHVGRPELQAHALLEQKKARDEIIKLTEQLKNEDPEMKLAAIPPEPLLAVMMERKTA